MSAYSSAVMALTPEAYLRLGESSGTTATDISGNGHHGTYHGSPTLGVAGAAGDSDTAVRFNGSGDYLTVPVPLSTLAVTNLTVMFFLYVPTYANDLGAAMMYGTDWYNDSIFCLPNHSSGTVVYGVSSSQPFTQQALDTFTRPSAGAWHHIIITSTDSGGGLTNAYVDCTQVGSGASGLGLAGVRRSDRSFNIAHNVTDGVDLACSIDEFAVITRVISSTERGSICSAIQETNPYWGVKAA